MQIRELKVSGAWEFTPVQHSDDRGVFLEWFTAPRFAGATGQQLTLAQANLSVSEAGVIRGIHFADVPPGQAKYVTCIHGAVLDVIVDLRVGSPTFGLWDTVLLDGVNRRAVYLSEGLGHGFMSLEDGSAVTYLCSTGYAPGREHGVNPLDSQLAIDWPTHSPSGASLTARLSQKDKDAPSLQEALTTGLLPDYAVTSAYIAGLHDRG